MNEGPGQGERWERLAAWLVDQLAVEEIDGIWVFRVVRREQREYGTAILSLVRGDRRRIVTASYTATIKGRERGGFVAEWVEVGSGPLAALHELLALVPIRADDEDPPAAVPVGQWFPPDSTDPGVPEDAAPTEIATVPDGGVGDA
ncbi:MAG TPA: hypothetical protein VFN22_02440 [Gemmatimonadales bacterium]|nr:hypothetical protein [Gemmatimonadales bacterium]